MATLPKPRIEAIQTVTSYKMTDPRVTRRVEPSSPASFRWCFNTVLYYRIAEGDSLSGWDLAGWIKDSLGKAFAEEPLLCGRLRGPETEGLGGFEIVSNDSGARLIEARIGITLDEFMVSEAREEAEAELVYWKDIDEHCPQFCPLFYIQVTNFECGGYSVGVSCSLLLADPPFIVGFIQRWATLQSSLVSQTDPPAKKPIFYLQSVGNTGSPSTLSPSPCINPARTVIFRADRQTVDQDTNKSLALLCAKAADADLGPNIPLLVREKSGAVKVENVARVDTPVGSGKKASGPRRVGWESFGVDGVAFWKGRLPARVSHWVGSPDGFVMVTPYDGEDDESSVYVFVTVR